MEIKNLPHKLRELLIKETQKQHPGWTEEYIINNRDVNSAFTWQDSTQGHDFWSDIHNGNIPKEYLEKRKEEKIINNYSIF